MPKDDEYRQNAKLAQEQADKAMIANAGCGSPKAGSVRSGRKTETEKFDRALAEQRTKQEFSDSLH